MPKKKTEGQKRREQRQARWKSESESIRNFRKKGPYFKKLLRMRGCDLPFYDFLDSYEEQFSRIAEDAVLRHPTLLGVHEIDGDDADWASMGYADLRQIAFDIGEDTPDYGAHVADANLRGSMSSFLDSSGELKTVILISRNIKTPVQHRESKYAFKLASLLHEIGHVTDLERRVNFDVEARKLNVIEAEVFAHLFALNAMADAHYRMSYEMLYGGLEKAQGGPGYLGQVATEVLARLPSVQLVNWQDYIDAGPTPDEIQSLGPEAVEVLRP